MKKEDLIIKWLDNNLDEKELEAFEQLDAFGSFKKIDGAIKKFKSPSFNPELHYEQVWKNRSLSKKYISLKKIMVSSAAILVIALGLYFGFSNSNRDTFFAQKTQTAVFNLPDASQVTLNSDSHISFNKTNWSQQRELTLEGEGFFKVTHGNSFTVNTSKGSVTVLGTQFSVNAREKFFEVVCYEGHVAVKTKNKEIELFAGNSIKIIQNELFEDSTPLSQPTWIEGMSSFKSIPYALVVKELERQYNIKINYNNNLESTLFTGTFPNKNLEAALQAITIPLKLYYQINGNKVMLKPNMQ